MMTIYTPEALARLSSEERKRLTDSHLFLGTQAGTQNELALDDVERYSGMYVFGVQGTGKSGFIETLIRQDVEKGNERGDKKGNAAVVIDAHGDMIDHCLAALPAHCLSKTYVLDMEDEDFPLRRQCLRDW